MRNSNVQVGVVLAMICIFPGCADQWMLLKRTTTGGDAYPKVQVGPASKVDLGAVNVGDTVVFAPGSMRAVVASPQVTIDLVELGSVTQAQLKKSLAINRREDASIEVMKGKLVRGDIMQTQISIDLSSKKKGKYDVDLVMFAFNRGKKAFRGDLTIYDNAPPELKFVGNDPPAKYNDRRGLKMSMVGMFFMGMDNFSRSNEIVEMQHEVVDQIHKYTLSRIVLEPGQAVGIPMRWKYTPPDATELDDLRSGARPMIGPSQQ